MMPIITATTQTVTTTEIDNEGEGWLKLGYNQGTDYSFTVDSETVIVDEIETKNLNVGDQTGVYGDMICYADPQRTLFVSGDSWYLFTAGTTSSVHKFTDTASVSNASGILTINDGSTVIYSGASPTWAYVPDTDGDYGFFTNGGLNLEDGKPKVAVGDYAGIMIYNGNYVLPVGTTGLYVTMNGDYAEGNVTWTVTEPIESDESEPTIVTDSSSSSITPLFGFVDPDYGTRIGDLYYTFSGTNATVIGYSSSIDWGTFNTIPDTVVNGSNTYTVTSIRKETFENCTDLALTSLPSGLTSIGENTFRGCTNLALTSLPDGMTSLGRYSFYNCTSLALTSLPDGLTSIGDNAFRNCTNLALTSLPSGLTSLSPNTFNGCTNLALTSLPSGLTSIEQGVFSGCTNLALTSLPSGLTSIGSSTFYKCTSLALTSLPSGLTSLSPNTFSGCTNLALTSLPDGITSIGQSVFSGCTNLALTSLPDGITSIGQQSFEGCTNLALTSLPSGLTSIDSYAFHNCTNLALTSLPSGLTSIRQGAFEGCTNLNSMIILGSPTIGTNVFNNTGIKEVLNLGETVITPTSYGLRADSVRSDIPAIGYIAPVSIHETVIVKDTSLSATLLKLLPVFMVLAVVIFIGYAMFRPDSDFIRSLKSRF